MARLALLIPSLCYFVPDRPEPKFAGRYPLKDLQVNVLRYCRGYDCVNNNNNITNNNNFI